MQNKVSIIVPFYNIREEYLNDCMSSLLQQTYNNIEIIIVDDGSNHEYSELLEQYRDQDKVRILYKENGGVASARNLGMAYMTGDWCMFVDPDDWLEHECIDYFLGSIPNEKKPDYIISKANLVNGENISENMNRISQSGFVDKESIIRDIVVNNNPDLTCVDTVWAKLYNVKYLRDNNLTFDATLRSGEDVPFSMNCTLKASNIYYLNRPTYNYRYNNSSECRTCKGLDTKSTAMLSAIDNILNTYNMQDSGYYDYYVMRVVSRLLRKYYNQYESESEFTKDFDNLMSHPEYKKVIEKPNTRYFEEHKSTLAQMCRDKNYSKIYSLVEENQIEK